MPPVQIELKEHQHEVAGDRPFTILSARTGTHRWQYVAFAEPYSLTTVIDGLKLLAEALNCDDRVRIHSDDADHTVIPGESHD